MGIKSVSVQNFALHKNCHAVSEQKAISSTCFAFNYIFYTFTGTKYFLDSLLKTNVKVIKSGVNSNFYCNVYIRQKINQSKVLLYL